jgi:uncharacterized damage-inducible protein DinB
MVPQQTLRLHLSYTALASRRLVEAAGLLTEDERTRDFKHADRNVLGTLVHIFAADRVWLGRILGNVPARFIDPETDMQMATLENDWPVLSSRWLEWIDTQTDESLLQPLQYRDLKGNEYQTPLWQIVLHVVNHATHHRGQVSAMLRAMGHTPPGVDLIFYYRELATSPVAQSAGQS